MNKTLLALVAGFSLMGASPDPKAVMQKHEEARKVSDIVSTATLVTGGGGSTERTKKFTWWRKLLSDGAHYNTFTRFSAPAEIKGQGILFLERPGSSPDVQLYLPTYKKIRRIQNQDQSSSFMGSEFSYSDISTPALEDFTYKYLRQEACGDAKCDVIEATPKDEAVRDRTGYSKETHWVRTDNSMIARTEFYDPEGKLWKKLEMSDIKIVDPAKKKWMAFKLDLKNERNGKFTRLEFESAGMKVNAGIKDNVFTPQNLEKGT